MSHNVFVEYLYPWGAFFHHQKCQVSYLHKKNPANGITCDRNEQQQQQQPQPSHQKTDIYQKIRTKQKDKKDPELLNLLVSKF